MFKFNAHILSDAQAIASLAKESYFKLTVVSFN